ncbi:hypothetical protein ROS9278_04361 [Roseomonas sp. CECT 9278]|nr:hypothetical protein ROS9278_04361 [Roseomonas sp. CECT 9278]
MLAALVVAAFLIRLPGLFAPAAWIDESASIAVGQLPWSVVLGEMARIEASPPGYYAIAKVMGAVAGPGAVPLRLLSAAAAALAVVPVWLFCRAAFGLRAAWLGAVLVALNAALLRLSQDGRTYAVLFLLFCCALLAAWRLVEAAREGRAGLGAVAGLGATQGAVLWLHHTAAIGNVGLNVFVLAALLAGRAGVLRGAVLLAGADALGLLVGGAPIYWALGHALGGEFVMGWLQPPNLVVAAQAYVYGVVAPFHAPLTLVTILASAVALLGGVLAWRRPGWPGRVALAVLLGVCGVLFPLLSQAWPMMMDRTVLFLVAPLAAGVAAGVALLPRAGFAAAALLLVGLHAHGAVALRHWPAEKEPWRDVVAELRARLAPGDRVVVTDSVFALVSLRLAGGGGFDALVVPATSRLESRAAVLVAPAAAVSPAGLCDRLRGAGRVWIVTRPPPASVAEDPHYSSRPAVLAALRDAAGERVEQVPAGTLLLEAWRVPGC